MLNRAASSFPKRQTFPVFFHLLTLYTNTKTGTGKLRDVIVNHWTDFRGVLVPFFEHLGVAYMQSSVPLFQFFINCLR